MTRRRSGAAAPARPMFDPEQPIAGWYRVKMNRDGAPCAVAIWYGAPVDPDTGEEMERPWRWQASRNGQLVDVHSVWPDCAKNPISKAEHDRLTAAAATMDERSGFYDVRRPIDLFTASLPF